MIPTPDVLTKRNEIIQATLDQECKRDNPDRKLIAEMASTIADNARRIAAMCNAPGNRLTEK